MCEHTDRRCPGLRCRCDCMNCIMGERGEAAVGMALLLVLVAAIVVIAVIGLAGAWNRAQVPMCQEDEVVSAEMTCVHPDTAEFYKGQWHDAGLIPPIQISK